MIQGRALRVYYVTVAVVAVLSIAIGLLVANLTGQYLAVFFAQILMAGVLAAWHPRVRKRSTQAK